MSLAQRFHAPPFEYMANRGSAGFTLTPPAVELDVAAYLTQLGRAVEQTSFDPNAAVNALVFGEWGHGKSHVLYRADAHLRRCSTALTLTLVPEVLSPKHVLGVAVAALRAMEPTIDLQPLRDAQEKVKDAADDDRGTERVVAKAFALLAKTAGRRHMALLFDEVQTTTNAFQPFVAALEREFRELHVVLHLLQCHSLATLDYALKVASDLGPWLRKARQIHLPAIQLRDAYAFFHERLQQCSADSELARNLIPDGVARTMCEAAGGNPRKMLQYAGQILRRCDELKESQFNGGHVLEVFAREPGVFTGERLYMESALRRIVDLLPQELGAFGTTIAALLRDRVDRLFGENEAIPALQLARDLGSVPGHQLQQLLREVDGIRLFSTREDEFGNQEFLLSDAFRRRLSSGFGSTGSVDLKTSQVGLLFRPAEMQAAIADGLSSILRHGNIATAMPRPEPLGELPPPAPAYLPTPFRGYRLSMLVERTVLDVPVLVTGVCGIAPPAALIQRIVEGLLKREWLFAYVVYGNADLPWSSWAEGDEAKALLEPLARTQAKIVPIEEESWGSLVDVSDALHLNQPGVLAAQFFADVVGARRALAADKPPEEAVTFAERLCKLMRTLGPSLAAVCYLPTDAERRLLDQRELWGDPNSPREVTLREMNERGDNWSTRSLGNLLESYIERRRSAFVRLRDEKCLVYAELLRVLEERRKEWLSLDDLRTEIDGRVLVAGPGDLRVTMEWLLRKLKAAGVAVVDPLGLAYRFRDVKREMKEKDSAVSLLLKDLRKRLDDVSRYRVSLAETLVADVAECEKRRPGHDVSMNDRLAQLTALEQDLTLIANRTKDVEEQTREEKRRVFEYLDGLLEKVTSDRALLPSKWQPIVLPDSQLERLRLGITELRSGVEGPRSGDGAEHLARQRDALATQLELAVSCVHGQAPTAGDALQELKNLVASRAPFRRVRVTAEVD